jgi:hypothetical protein
MNDNKDYMDALVTVKNQSTELEPISFVELSEVFGGTSDKNADAQEPIKTNGHAGGLICWCS